MTGRDHVRRNRASWNADSDAYQGRHGEQLDTEAPAWGVWGLPEAELRVLGDLRGKRVLEFGCGAAQWTILLRREGVDCVGLDLSERQLAHAQRLGRQEKSLPPLVQASAEETPFLDGTFDVVFCDHGAMTFADPLRTVPEAARVLRPGGLFVFNMSSPLKELLYDDEKYVDTRTVQRGYFDLHAQVDGDDTSFQLPYGRWIRLFREHGLEVEDLVELRPGPEATTSYGDYIRHAEARNHCLEHIWKVRKKP